MDHFSLLWETFTFTQCTIISSSLLLLTHTLIFDSVFSNIMNLLAQKTFPCSDPVSLCYQSIHLSEPVSGNHSIFLLKWLLFQTLHLPLKQNNFLTAAFRSQAQKLVHSNTSSSQAIYRTSNLETVTSITLHLNNYRYTNDFIERWFNFECNQFRINGFIL